VHTRPTGRPGRPGVTRVLEGPIGAPHVFDQGRYGNGVLDAGHESQPRMESAKFTGEFPFARAGRTLTLEIG